MCAVLLPFFLASWLQVALRAGFCVGISVRVPHHGCLVSDGTGCSLLAMHASYATPPQVVETLIESDHKVAMITGDAALTALHVARDTGIVSSQSEGRQVLVLEPTPPPTTTAAAAAAAASSSSSSGGEDGSSPAAGARWIRATGSDEERASSVQDFMEAPSMRDLSKTHDLMVRARGGLDWRWWWWWYRRRRRGRGGDGCTPPGAAFSHARMLARISAFRSALVYVSTLVYVSSFVTLLNRMPLFHWGSCGPQATMAGLEAADEASDGLVWHDVDCIKVFARMSPQGKARVRGGASRREEGDCPAPLRVVVIVGGFSADGVSAKAVVVVAG
jgi:magnesium-transporting ATPase (P-type)